jgi:hypothetical protein
MLTIRPRPTTSQGLHQNLLGNPAQACCLGRENLPDGIALFAFPQAGRKCMRTANCCENINSQIKKRLLASCPAINRQKGFSPVPSWKCPKLERQAKPTFPLNEQQTNPKTSKATTFSKKPSAYYRK